MNKKVKTPFRILIGLLGMLGLLACKSCTKVINAPSLYGGPPEEFRPIENDSIE